ncbi:glucosamine-6-phosphate deaminase [Maliponia aquimaris]|uniref:Glucosamine-6-phosphate deaminase n=1 Tax=Maliponia aquimaris TaxID=1673631 RepID=A0A238L1N3_9RHOB|nr:glucosamine-6-phosphate deaminase [Maliponia aquimaris]SMX48897.1 Glucosamine-6-phosphate deaminase 1 [Maliponia aquimaris]
MKILILDEPVQAIARVGDIVADQVRRKPDAVLGLATGGTMVPLYDDLAARHRDSGLSFAGVTSFNLDEYVGLAPEHPRSYHAYMREVLFDRIDIDAAQTHLPRGDSADPLAEAERYEAAIAAAGGIDLQLLGIGQNGHIGFNEPTSSLASRTRIKTLSDDTRRANQRFFGSFDETPRYALTIGVATILDSRFCLLLATGSAKAAAVAAMVEGPVSAACPASALQFHRNATVVLDREAAAGLKLTAYYQHVHPGGQDSAFG